MIVQNKQVKRQYVDWCKDELEFHFKSVKKFCDFYTANQMECIMDRIKEPFFKIIDNIRIPYVLKFPIVNGVNINTFGVIYIRFKVMRKDSTSEFENFVIELDTNPRRVANVLYYNVDDSHHTTLMSPMYADDVINKINSL